MTAPLRLVPPAADRTPQCDTPRDDHEGEVHLYPCGYRCDKHAPGPAIRLVTEPLDGAA